jgi:hypothetical protein
MKPFRECADRTKLLRIRAYVNWYATRKEEWPSGQTVLDEFDISPVELDQLLGEVEILGVGLEAGPYRTPKELLKVEISASGNLRMERKFHTSVAEMIANVLESKTHP